MKKIKVQTEAKNLFFEEVVNSITQDINERAVKMIADRFGFKRSKIKTLGEIGGNYGITRERVRQIVKEAINKVKRKAQQDQLFKKAEEKIKFTLKEKRGIIAKKDLIKELSSHKDENNFINFILHCSDEFDLVGDEVEMKDAVVHQQFDFDFWKDIKEGAKKILHSSEKTLDSEEFFVEFNKLRSDLEKEDFFSFLSVSREIEKGVFEKWGMAHWKDITPKGVREKAYLIIKETKEPLHFRDVARLIDEYKLSKRVTHPQTVHNELIKDERFVLVGRGTYALKEWGYRKGTVKEVIEDILKNSQQPLHQEEIVEKVLSVRNVKRTTIIINLNNFFQRMDKQKYSVKKVS